MSGFRTIPNPDQPDRCPSIDPYDTLQCGRRIHDDDACRYGGIGWKKGTPRHVTAEEQVEVLRDEVERLTAMLSRVEVLAEEWRWKDPGEPPAPEWEILDAASADLLRALAGDGADHG